MLGLNNDSYAQRLAHFGDRVEAWAGVGPQGLIKRFTANASGLGNLRHASRTGSHAQRVGEFAGIAFLDNLCQVGGGVFIVAQIARRIEGGKWACPIPPDRSDGMIMPGEQSDGTKQKTFHGRVQARGGTAG